MSHENGFKSSCRVKVPVAVSSREVRSQPWEQNISYTVSGEHQLVSPKSDPASDGVSFGRHCAAGSQTARVERNFWLTGAAKWTRAAMMQGSALFTYGWGHVAKQHDDDSAYMMSGSCCYNCCPHS